MVCLVAVCSALAAGVAWEHQPAVPAWFAYAVRDCRGRSPGHASICFGPSPRVVRATCALSKTETPNVRLVLVDGALGTCRGCSRNVALVAVVCTHVSRVTLAVSYKTLPNVNCHGVVSALHAWEVPNLAFVRTDLASLALRVDTGDTAPVASLTQTVLRARPSGQKCWIALSVHTTCVCWVVRR